MDFDRNSADGRGTFIPLVAAGAAALLGTAAVVAACARGSERAHPPAGRFIDVSGVRVHYLDEGSGPPIVLVHGNAMSSEDFKASGLVTTLAARHRVIVFDRPGFGYTGRPRGTDWTPIRQAELLHEALDALGIVRPVVVGHSLGALVTVALALAHPSDAEALVLLSGYYYPSMPPGLSPFAAAAMPVLGDMMRYTVSPVLARVMAPLLTRQMFAPSPVSERFANYPLSMARRPSQIRATMEDANYMDASAAQLAERYGELSLPIEILAGDGDAVVNSRAQSERLARALPNAAYARIPGAGHMIEYIAPELDVAAIERAAARSRETVAA